ncbi:hypothetical protein HCG51_25120 [Tolypothrix sp. PCC 7910]|uniref:hypothetical protein n=1 Tax=Tolypothrix sp. PCC 7910 TaxID=2099387 RepID=UPI0014278B5E|nr:hypothetical protein [Tolypothrix sp. PCC 7910]QIR39668.1 hypothetical protein HCG51_25120 [Tolypothrix sp. PCC 7910]
MLNNINQFCASRQLKISAVALVMALSVFGEQTQPVFSQQIEVNSHNSSASLLSQLREVKGQRNQAWTTAETSNNIAESVTNPSEKSDFQTSAKGLNKAHQTTVIASSNQKSAKEAANVPMSNVPNRDGVYLYGQSPAPNQIGQGYIVFEKRQGKVNGALYMPNSEFSCFQGTIDRSGELAMTVNGSADESASNEVATRNTIPTISEEELSSYPYSVALQDYHQLKSISANDRRILQMCNQPSN